MREDHNADSGGATGIITRSGSVGTSKPRIERLENLPAATNLRHLSADEMVSAVIEQELGIDWNSESAGVGQDNGGRR